MRGPCPARRLEQALTASAIGAGICVQIDAHRTIAWYSATFAGDRHQLEARATSCARLDRWLSSVPTLDIILPGHLLAELSIAHCERIGAVTRFRIDGVTVETA